ncbi:MAG: hypothetical protein PUF62_09745 [Bacteroidales bacterium]|nr:hypothetical protein [Bacteroidales bacterium]
MGNYDDDNSPYDPEEDLEMMFPDEDARAEFDEDGYSYPEY